MKKLGYLLELKEEKISIKGIFKLYLLMLATLIPIYILIGVLKSNNIIPQFSHNISKSLTGETDRLVLILLFVKTVLLGPIFEEVVFRLVLKWRKLNFVISLSLFSSFLFVSLAGINIIILSSDARHFSFLFNTLIWGIIFLPFWYFISSTLSDEKMIIVWGKYFNYILFFSCTSFALIHINSISVGFPFWVIAILITPPFISGIYLSFTRMKYGVIGAIMLHSFYNLVVYILVVGKGFLLRSV